MGKIARVQNKVRLAVQPVDLVDGCLKRARNVRIGRLVEPDVAVADLHESEVFLLLRRRAQQSR